MDQINFYARTDQKLILKRSSQVVVNFVKDNGAVESLSTTKERLDEKKNYHSKPAEPPPELQKVFGTRRKSQSKGFVYFGGTRAEFLRRRVALSDLLVVKHIKNRGSKFFFDCVSDVVPVRAEKTESLTL